MKPPKKVIHHFFILFIISVSFSQEITITGRITDSLSQPIARVSIIASYDSDEATIDNYTTTDKDGSFLLILKQKNDLKDLWISFRHISYSAQRIKLQNKSQTIKVILLEKFNLLDEVILNAKKTVSVKGDTITYHVQGVKKEKDYSIEEVISRIPGVKISENGQISYNKKIISHLYINGVDLLEGRYNIATRGIPADAVEEINIIQRHNHARIDKGRTESDNVAFNLKIKENHSLIFGSGKADAGLPILTANAEITPIFLKEDFQNIASAKTNNFGMPLQEHGISLTRENNDIEELSIDSYSLLSAPNTNGTTISNRYWLDNNSVSLTNDALVKSGKALILKAGINYNYNDNELQQNANEVFFFGQDSTVINRKVKNKLTSNAYYIGLVQEINNEKLYLKNKTTINEERSSGFSNVVQNDNYLKYLYTDENLALKNTTEFKTIINNKIINSGLLLEYITNRESNDVIPSVFINEIPNSGIPYQTNQTINTKQFSFGAYSSYSFKIKNSNAQIKQRINWSNESLNSNVQQYSDTPEEELPFPFTSDFRLNTFESLTTFKSVFTIKDVTITLNPELKYINLKKQELLAQDLDNQNDFIFLQPRTSFKYKIDHQWTASLTGNYLSSVSRFPQLFNAVILRDYGNLYRNPNETNVTQTGIGTLYFGYSNILKGFLFSNSTSLSRSESDFIFSSSIDSNGLVQIEAVKGSNERNDFTNTTNLTKRFFRILKTDLNYKFNQATDNQIFNTIQQETLSTNHSLEVNLNIDNNTWYGFNYNGDFIFGKTKSNEFITSNTFINHTLELDFYTSSKTRINLGTESVFSSYSSSDVNSKNTLFNAEFYYKPSKKLFLRASFNNIFNEKFFTTIQSNSNLVARSQFKLRPRQFTIGLNYSF